MNSRSLYLFSPLVLGLVWSGLVWGCSASGKGADFEETTASGEPSGNGGSGSTGPGGQGNNTGFGGDLINFDAGSDATIDDDAACAATSSQAEFIPLDIVMIMDRSSSMLFESKWEGATNALKDYVNSPDAAGVNVGILYFPIDAPPDGQICNYVHYKKLAVPIGELPGNAAAMTSSIDNEDANGGSTPMYGAMKGAYFIATAHQDANPTHKVIVVFASDGEPNACEGVGDNPPGSDTIPIISDLAKSALNYNGVKTYVIAMKGATVINLDQIAAKGGTTQALDVTQNVSLFFDKMKEIQAAALSCDFKIPDPPVGETFDKDLVQVIYDPSDPQKEDVQVPHADNLQDCGQSSGWYYDNNVKPTKIVLCPKSCQAVQSDQKAKISVLFGCKPDLN